MSKKKSGAGKSAPVHSTKQEVPQKRGPSKTIWILGALAIVVVGAWAISARSGGIGGATAVASPEEAKYMGRYLPEGYSAPQIAEAWVVSAATKMTPTTVTATAEEVSIPVADVAARKIVSFEYQKGENEAVSMVAYVRPSGKVFVGVSYCVPCKGIGQRLEADGTLTCESCGTTRDPETGVGISGACKLYPLDEVPVKLAGDRIEIDKAALDSWVVQPIDRSVGG